MLELMHGAALAMIQASFECPKNDSLAKIANLCYRKAMNVSLTPHYEKLVKTCVESGRYNNASEVMREALRIWEKQHCYEDWLRQQAQSGYEDVLTGKTVKVDSKAGFMKLVKP